VTERGGAAAGEAENVGANLSGTDGAGAGSSSGAWIADGAVTAPRGFSAAAATAGLKPSGAPDVALIVADGPCAAAGVFTRNLVAAAPVRLDRAALAASGGRARVVVANSGNANACTGPAGDEAARAMQSAAARAVGCPPGEVLVLSTGVIGVPLDVPLVTAGIAQAAGVLAAGPAAGLAAAEAIRTTDTCAKHAALRVSLSGGEVVLGGIAKGSGMIHPDMATMLAVITTDADLTPAQASGQLSTAVEHSFNRISVDGDTSTNDTVLLLAGGASGVRLSDPADEATFARALGALCADLARAIVRDGEGASRFVTLHVTGAASEADAVAVGRTIATSPLVKTAFAGGDPNWGRILAAAGRAGVDLDPDRLRLWIAPGEAQPAAGEAAAPADSGAPPSEPPDGAVVLAREGGAADFDTRAAAAIMSAPAIRVGLDLGQGRAAATLWTTDLTHEYVTINAEYTT
jgi:glutamate N-acetyltransferase/amino-acid N-acetyltransferase